MTLAADLASGACGVRCRLPEGSVLQDEGPNLVLRSEALGVVLLARRLPWRLDLREAHRAALAADVERQTRAIFEAEHVASGPTDHCRFKIADASAVS
jgi:hypothetical protein